MSRTTAITLALLLWLPSAVFAASGPDDLPNDTPVPVPEFDWTGQWCRYPQRLASIQGAKTGGAAKELVQQRTVVVNEVEPNDVFATSQSIILGPDPVAPVDVDVRGRIQPGADIDLYRFFATKGDVLGLAVLGESSLDPTVAVAQLNEVDLVMNDDDPGVFSLYPAKSPLPRGLRFLDSVLTWVCPQDGEYLIKVASFASASNGQYTLQIRAHRSGPENEQVGARQIIFLDFNGATINAPALFGIGRNPAVLSPLQLFLPFWGLEFEDEAEVVEAIIQVVEDTFDQLRQARLNGNRPTDQVVGHFDVEIRNSRDHPDPWGEPNVSRVIIGGTSDEFGVFGFLGIAEAIDPGNFAREETAVVLLDIMSLPVGIDPLLDLFTINSIRVQAPLTFVDAIGAAVGKVVAHEIGHYLGLWHTDNTNEVPCIIDQGGNPIWITAGAGPDRTLGTGDDEDQLFIPDEYIPNEAVGVGEEEVDFRTAFALSSGRVERDMPPGSEPPTLPLGAVRATPTAGNAPLTVQFFAGAISDNAGSLTFVWDFRDGSDPAIGPAVTHTFTQGGEFLVKVTVSDSSGATGEATVLIRVSGLAPTAVLGATPKTGPAPLQVSFTGTGSLPPAGGQITAYAWNFGDGTTGSGSSAQHTYSTAGTYTAKLTVTGNNGMTSEASTTIVVGSQTSSGGNEPNTNTIAAPCALGALPAAVGTLLGLVGLRLRRRP